MSRTIRSVSLTGLAASGVALVCAGVAFADFGFITSHGTRGSGDGQFVDAHGLAVDSAGNLYVADGGNSRIQVLTASGGFLRKWGSHGTGDGQFGRLLDVAVGGSGNVYAAEGAWGGGGRNLIQKFDPSGNLLAKWGGVDFNGIAGIAVDAADNVYVADAGADKIWKFDSAGNLLHQWGSSGAAPGQFYFHKLSAITVDAAGNVYTLEGNDGPDPSPRRVQKFDPSGTPKPDFVDGSGNPTSEFTAIAGAGIDVDAAGNIFVVGSNELARFTATGASAGGVTGCQTLMRGITAHPNGMVYAGNSTGVLVFGEGGISCQAPAAPARLIFEGDEGVTINGGALYTNDSVVELTVEPPANTEELRISNDGGFQTAATLPVTPSRLYGWTLDSSGPERLPKTVYVRFSNDAENSSQNFTDDIILDQTPPELGSAAVTGGESAPAVAAAKRRFTIRTQARDNASGVAKMRLAVRRGKPGRIRPYRKRLAIRATRAPRFVRVFDGAGNRSSWRKLRRG